jgi:Protein of unknown function (DUF3500)
MMKLSRLGLAGALLVGLAGVAYVSQRAETPAQKMARAAQEFLASLKDEQKTKATFPFDSPERTNWWFVPREKDKKPTRKGLPLKEMTAEQKKAALALVAAGTSATGDKQAVTIMSLEAILRDQEKGRAPVRDPEWYFFTVFGSPSRNGKWGWRVEGHHLSLNFTLDGRQVVSSTPAFFGANPAEVKGGPDKGMRTLAAVEDLAIQLFNALDDGQKKVAYRDKPFPDPAPQQATVKPAVGPPTGLPAAKMTDKQQSLLTKLVETYAHRMPPEVAEAELKEVRKAGVDKIHFAYTGGTKAGEPHTYRVQGPTFVIEFLNVQQDSAGNPANHIHSVWRRIEGDFGLSSR